MKSKQIEFKVGKETLRGTMFIPSGKGPFPGVVFFHGSGGVGEMHLESAKKLAKHGILGFFFNYRGAGPSDGKFEDQTIAMGVEDSKKAIKYFLSLEEIDKDRLGFCGGSFGGFIASLLCNSVDLKSLVLVAPAAFSQKSFSNQRDEDRDLANGFMESRSYKQIEKYSGKLLVEICEKDDVLPDGMAEEYFKRAKRARKKEKYVIKNAKHRLSIQPGHRKDSQDKLISWFLKTL